MALLRAADYFNPKALMEDDKFIEPDNENFYRPTP